MKAGHKKKKKKKKPKQTNKQTKQHEELDYLKQLFCRRVFVESGKDWRYHCPTRHIAVDEQKPVRCLRHFKG
jgi:hypothetical protein